MSRFHFSNPIAVLALAAWVAVGFAAASRAQFLGPGKTAPAPEFRGVTKWVNGFDRELMYPNLCGNRGFQFSPAGLEP
jgi:hypothetical protein